MPKKKKSDDEYKKNVSLETNENKPMLLEEQLDEQDKNNIPFSTRMFQYFKSLDNNKYFAGLCMIMLNIGSKYITIELSKTQQSYLRNSIMRQVLLFSIAWIGTRDVVISLVITGVFIVMTQFLFNEDSRMCVIPKRYQTIIDKIDTNNDNIISEQELESAIKILQKAKTKSAQNGMMKQQRVIQNQALQQRTFIG